MTNAINKRIKEGLQRAVHGLGYDIHRLSSFPYTIESRPEHGSFPFWIADDMARLWYEEVPQYMDTEIAELGRLVRPGDRVLEIGSHHGYFTVVLAHAVGSEGFVCGLEAAPDNALVAQAQITLNSLGRTATVLHRAGAELPGSIGFVQDERARNTNGQVATTQRDGRSGLRTIDVPAVTGDEIDARYGPFDLVKLDVEGYEGAILKGCTRLLKRRPRLAIELHPADLPKFNMNVAAIMQIIAAESYNGTMILRDNFEIVVPFDAARIGGDQPVNIFLSPRESELEQAQS